MAYVVRAETGIKGEPTFLADKATRKDALETAIVLLGQGMINVTIMGDDGRVYSAPDFADTLDDDS